MCFSSILSWKLRIIPYLCEIDVRIPTSFWSLIKNIKFEPGVKTCINCSRMNSSIIWYPLFYRTNILKNRRLKTWSYVLFIRGSSFGDLIMRRWHEEAEGAWTYCSMDVGSIKMKLKIKYYLRKAQTIYSEFNYFHHLAGAPLHTLSKLYDVPVVFVPPPLFWGWILLILRSPKGGCCSISDDLSCSLIKKLSIKNYFPWGARYIYKLTYHATK